MSPLEDVFADRIAWGDALCARLLEGRRCLRPAEAVWDGELVCLDCADDLLELAAAWEIAGARFVAELAR